MTDRTATVVSALSIGADAIEMSVMQLPNDQRDIAGEPVVMMRTVVVGRSNPAYADEIRELVEAAEALAADVLEDWGSATPVVVEDDDDDDDRGMGHG